MECADEKAKIQLIELIRKIRKEIGHQDIDIHIKELIVDEKKGNMYIITPDRPEKSSIIGKGGWVVGRLKEELQINNIHVEAYTDVWIRQYRVMLALKKMEDILEKKSFNKSPFHNLAYLLRKRLDNAYDLTVLLDELMNIEKEKTSVDNTRVLVALSGGVDSSFSLIVAQMIGFHPIAVTIDPGSIILPSHFRERINKLTKKLKVSHKYISVDMDDIISDSLEGHFHPCGRCSKVIEFKVFEEARKNNIPIVIFGDLLSTGSQALLFQEGILRIHMPALLAATKGDVKSLVSNYGLKKNIVYGCPLLREVHKTHNSMRRYSLQRILRETRAGVLEPGEALNLIMSLFN